MYPTFFASSLKAVVTVPLIYVFICAVRQCVPCTNIFVCLVQIYLFAYVSGAMAWMSLSYWLKNSSRKTGCQNESYFDNIL